jgi:ribosome-associated protein
LPAGRQEQPLVDLIAQAVENKKGLDLTILDVRKSSEIADYLVICGVESTPQIRAIEKEIDTQLRLNDFKNYKWEGVINSGWVVLDLGSVVVHILGTAEREYYRLEDLWGKEAIIYHY